MDYLIALSLCVYVCVCVCAHARASACGVCLVLSTIAPWRLNQSIDNWIYLLTLRSMNHFCIDAPLSLVSKDLDAIEVI